MAFVQLICTAQKLNKLKKQVIEEKLDAIKVDSKEKPKWRLRHVAVDIRHFFKRFFKRALSCFFFEKFCYNLRHDGSCENYTLKSFFGFSGGFLLTYIFFMFCVFQLDFKLTTATVMCSLLGCVLTNGLAFSSKVRSKTSIGSRDAKAEGLGRWWTLYPKSSDVNILTNNKQFTIKKLLRTVRTTKIIETT